MNLSTDLMGATAYGHWQTESTLPADPGVFVLHWPGKDKAKMITFWRDLTEGTLIPVVNSLAMFCHSWSELPH